jgi:hypothetical protein
MGFDKHPKGCGTDVDNTVKRCGRLCAGLGTNGPNRCCSMNSTYTAPKKI